MNIEFLNDIPPLTTDSLVAEAQVLFNELTFSHLPVVDGFEYLGSVAEYDIRGFDGDKMIREYADYYEHFSVKEDVNALEMMEAASKHQSNVIPVLSQNEGRYLGYVELSNIMSAFGDMPFLNEYGNIIVVQKGVVDHSLSEVCQIVESNNTKILCTYVSKMEKDVVQTTLKIGDGDFNAIVQTFRRYGYEIVSDHYDDVFLNNLKERSRYFTKYLNM